MPSWTHLIRFVAVEDSQIHLGQLVDTTRDVGQDSLDNVPIHALVIEGSAFGGQVTEKILQVQHVCQALCRV